MFRLQARGILGKNKEAGRKTVEKSRQYKTEYNISKSVHEVTVANTGGATRRVVVAVGAAGILLAVSPGAAIALNLYNGSASGNNLEINLQTTVSYTPIFRVGGVSKILTSP